jgi:pimeloyl-ACP methyl ester carboxylesterase
VTGSPPTSGVLDVPDGRLWFETRGSGPDVLLIHPGLWDARTWDPQMPVLVDAGYRVTRYDLRGYGRSSRLGGERFSNVRDLFAVLDAAGVERTALVGCSMGGAIAIDAALTEPDRTWALVPVAAGLGGFESTAEEDDWWAERDAPIEAAIAAGDLERARELQLEIWAPRGTDDPAGRAIRRIAFDNLHELTMDESGAEELEPPAARRLGEIAVPTLVIEAELDPPDMRRIGQLIAAAVPDARRVTIPGADHVVNLREPAAFDAALLPFLDEFRPRG